MALGATRKTTNPWGGRAKKDMCCLLRQLVVRVGGRFDHMCTLWGGDQQKAVIRKGGWSIELARESFTRTAADAHNVAYSLASQGAAKLLLHGPVRFTLDATDVGGRSILDGAVVLPSNMAARLPPQAPAELSLQTCRKTCWYAV